jgi:hypothetical protein
MAREVGRNLSLNYQARVWISFSRSRHLKQNSEPQAQKWQ